MYRKINTTGHVRGGDTISKLYDYLGRWVLTNTMGPRNPWEYIAGPDVFISVIPEARSGPPILYIQIDPRSATDGMKR